MIKKENGYRPMYRKYSTTFRVNRMFKHLDLQQTNKVKDSMFLVEHEPGDVVIREGVSCLVKGSVWHKWDECECEGGVAGRASPLDILL